MFINALDHGLLNDGTPQPAQLLADVVEYAVASKVGAGGTTVYFPSGSYRFTGTAHIDRSDYEFYRLRLKGDGKSNTVFHKVERDSDLLHFTNSSGYTAVLSLHGIGFFHGVSVLRAENLYYSEIVDCGFRGTGASDGRYSIHLEGNTNKVLIDNIWAYHGADLLYVNNGYVHLSNSQIGEDVGEICVGGGLWATGVQWDGDAFSRRERTMGPAAVHVASGSRAFFTGCVAHVRPDKAFVNFHQAQGVSMDGCHFVLWGGSIIRNHWMGYGRGVSINGGMAHVRASSDLWARHGGVAPTDSAIRDVRFVLADYQTCTVDDAFFDPSRRNVYSGNTATWKV